MQTRVSNEVGKGGKVHFLKKSPGLRPGPRFPPLPSSSFFLFPLFFSLPPLLRATLTTLSDPIRIANAQQVLKRLLFIP